MVGRNIENHWVGQVSLGWPAHHGPLGTPWDHHAAGQRRMTAIIYVTYLWDTTLEGDNVISLFLKPGHARMPFHIVQQGKTGPLNGISGAHFF